MGGTVMWITHIVKQRLGYCNKEKHLQQGETLIMLCLVFLLCFWRLHLCRPVDLIDPMILFIVLLLNVHRQHS